MRESADLFTETAVTKFIVMIMITVIIDLIIIGVCAWVVIDNNTLIILGVISLIIFDLSSLIIIDLISLIILGVISLIITDHP